MNISTFIGRLTKDPELRKTGSGVSVCSADIAIEDGFGDKKKAYYPTLVFWRQQAEFISQYGGKGDLIAATGRYTERKWTDKSGQNHTSVEFQCSEVKLLAKKGRQGGCEAAGAAADTYPSTDTGFTEIDDQDGELPF